jgi:Protein of unknown function (DUF4236)
VAWNFRRSVNLGPLRINASKSGIGYSIGTRGFRIGKDAKGRSYTAASIPGTGIYRRDYLKKPNQQASGSALPVAPQHTTALGTTAATLPKPAQRRILKSCGSVLLYLGGASILYIVVRTLF